MKKRNDRKRRREQRTPKAYLRAAYVLTRPQKVFVICTVIFITTLVVAEVTASKFFTALA